MITPEYAQMMARYNHWQNDSLVNAASTLTDEDRWAERGAFWGSIGATFRHIYWADFLWLARFGVVEAPKITSFADAQAHIDWDEFVGQRRDLDAVICDWADGMGQADIDGVLTYKSISYGELSNPKAPLIVHIFNHATYHRGQIHMMLTAAGAKPDDTDIPIMPQEYKEYRS